MIEAPSSTKNREKKRDPEARSTKKGNNWHFGHKAHIGVDKKTGLVHHLKTTSANEHDVTVAAELLSGKEKTIYGDSGYLGIEKRPEAILKNIKGKKIKYKINQRPSMIQKLPENKQSKAKKKEHKKSSVRCKVEHVFAVVKNIFHYRTTRYRGLKNKPLNRISCSHWRICIWLTDFLHRSDSVCLCVKNRIFLCSLGISVEYFSLLFVLIIHYTMLPIECIQGAKLEETGFSYTMSLIQGKYKMLILYTLMEFGIVHFNEMKKYVGGISYKTLSATLKELETDGLVNRKEYPQIPPKVEYSLTERGRSLIPILYQMCA